MKIYNQTEVSIFPAIGYFVKIPALAGGAFCAFVAPIASTEKWHAYVGGGSESEPIFKINHAFETRLEAALYAELLCRYEELECLELINTTGKTIEFYAEII